MGGLTNANSWGAMIAWTIIRVLGSPEINFYFHFSFAENDIWTFLGKVNFEPKVF